MKFRLFLLLSALFIAASCAGPQCDNEKSIWICSDNSALFSNTDSVDFYLNKIKKTGFNTVVIDLKGVRGDSLVNSSYAIDKAHKLGLKVYLSMCVLPVGSPERQEGLVYDNPELKAMTCLQYLPEGMVKIEDNPKEVAAFLNPALPEARDYAIDALMKNVCQYDCEGFCLDYCRYSGICSDFSEVSRSQFEEFIGEKVPCFPQDIFTYDADGGVVPGKYYRQWWTWRSGVIKDLISRISDEIHAAKPDVKVCYWAATWLHAIYGNGQNWAAEGAPYYKEYLDSWADEGYGATGFAQELDEFMAGAYLEKVWGKDDPESIEFALARSSRDIAGACTLVGSVYAENTRDQFADAVYLCLRETEGVTVFDISQVIQYDLWDAIHEGFTRAAEQTRTYSVSSPDKNITITVNDGKELSWSVSKGSEEILAPSVIGMDVKGKKLDSGRARVSTKHIDETMTSLVPTKFRTVQDKCNQLTLTYKGWAVEFRAYDNGVAYRFRTSWEDSVEVVSERSEWNFAAEPEVYWANEKSETLMSHCEANFVKAPLGKVDPQSYCFLPLSAKTQGGTRVVITETDLFDYPNMLLNSSLKAFHPAVIDEFEMRTDRDVTIKKNADVIARTGGARTYPWRVMTIGDDRELLENTLPWQLASKEAPGDYGWLRPGKVSWEWWNGLNLFGVDFRAGVNMDTYKYYIDFAAHYGLEYVLLDEGWSASTLNIVECQKDLDVAALAEYGKSKGVGIVLWTLWTPMWKDLESILDVYEKWGVAGIKIDFMQMLDQNMVNFYERVASECCKRHLLVDYHGAYKPAGLQRKYPNAMNFEGVLGMEMDKCSDWITPGHDLELPFTRMVAGPMDYTPGAVNNAVKNDFAALWDHPMSMGTRSHQVALFVVYEGPMMMLCDSPSKYYGANDYTSFISKVPTVWEKTVAQEAVSGEYLVMSRRTADGRWFSAALTDWTARDLALDTSFLEEGEWTVTIHRDGINADRWAEDYVLETATVKAGETVRMHLAPGGGWAASFTRK